MGSVVRYAIVALIAFCVAIAATWLARTWIDPHEAQGGELHALMHDKLDLDPAQKVRIEALESDFAAQRQIFDQALRDTNAQLATAIASERQYGPRVADAVDRSHMAMGELQKATLRHVFAMRAVLRPDQAARFDAAVAKALTEPARR